VTFRVAKIVSGGQTGVDRAALDVAMALQIPCGGWCPRGRRAEDGQIHERYPLEETDSRSYASRTIQNVVDSDGTLLLAFGRVSGGTLLTKNVAEQRRKPCLVVDLTNPPQVADVQDWMREHEIRVLNVAGPRASQAPDAYRLATSLLVKLLKPAVPIARKRRRVRPKA
jgi:Circularly permutated YpsA SLOG family